jgi:CO/xanthine dehydrogenase FAD-binding subunit
MKPPPFQYVAADSVEHAVALLAEHDGGAKLLAGGQSLVPMLNFRLLAPEVLIDINRIPGLDGVSERDGGLWIGALTRHRTLETSDLVRAKFPVITEAMRHVAHLAIRNRGTIGGSLCHADPAAELPLMTVLLDARLAIASASGNRELAATEFFDGALTTVLGEDEMLTGIFLPALPAGSGWGFEEVARRSGDFALAAVAATLTVENGRIAASRLAVMGAHETPLRIAEAEAALAGAAPDADTFATASDIAAAAVEPNDDLHASADYRRHLVRVLTGRVLAAAAARAAGGAA